MKRDHITVVGGHIQGYFMRVKTFPKEDETVIGWDFKEALDGGKGSHQAIGCARLGIPTYFIGKVGRDRLGKRGTQWMKDAKVNLKYLKFSDNKPTGAGFVMINPEGVPAITSDLGANGDLSREDIDSAKEAILKSSYIMVSLEIPVDIGLYACEVGKKLGATVILNPAPSRFLVGKSLGDVDILTPNTAEAKTILEIDPDENVEPRILAEKISKKFKINIIAISLGSKGAFVYNNGSCYEIPPIKVKQIDTPGAGDAFNAGIAFGLMKGFSFKDSVFIGCLCGGYAVTIRESIPSYPTITQLKKFAKEKNITILENI
jgi:ribokinase